MPYYIAEIYTQLKNYDKAQIVAQNYLSAYPNNELRRRNVPHTGRCLLPFRAISPSRRSIQQLSERECCPRRDALYMLGLSYYQTKVYSKAAETLGEVTTDNDALTQNAYLHMGLAYLQLADKNKARMAFEQAAASNANLKIKEQAAYNYALCMHETSYSAFGESVTVFREIPERISKLSLCRESQQLPGGSVHEYTQLRCRTQIHRPHCHPSKAILEAKQKILFQLGTQSFANTQFEQAIGYFNQSVTLGQYNLQTKADALYWLASLITA